MTETFRKFKMIYDKGLNLEYLLLHLANTFNNKIGKIAAVREEAVVSFI